MPDLTPLRDLTSWVTPPDLDSLSQVARRRRRREVAVGIGGVVVGLAVVAAVLVPDVPDASPEPARPDRTDRLDRTGSTSVLERIRDTGQVWEADTGTEDLRARRIGCVPPKCAEEPGEPKVVVEVSDDDFVTSALYPVRTPGGGSAPHVAPYDETRVLVYDYVDRAPWTRYRLLGPPGVPPVELQYVNEAAAPGPGPAAADVVVPSFDPFLIDEEAATIRPVAVPAGVHYWSRDTADALWGVDSGSCLVHVLGPDGAFTAHTLDCGGRTLEIPWFDDAVPPDWFDAQHLAVVEVDGPGATAVHASVDGGRTWQRVPASGSAEDRYAGVAQVLATLE